MTMANVSEFHSQVDGGNTSMDHLGFFLKEKNNDSILSHTSKLMWNSSLLIVQKINGSIRSRLKK